MRFAPRAGAATSLAAALPGFAPGLALNRLPPAVRATSRLLALLRLVLAGDFPPAAFTPAFLASAFLAPAFSGPFFRAAGFLAAGLLLRFGLVLLAFVGLVAMTALLTGRLYSWRAEGPVAAGR
jgi:hypothetical protein